MQLNDWTFIVLCLGGLLALVVYMTKRKSLPSSGHMAKSESRHKEMPPDLTVPEDFYRLQWKPSLVPVELPENLREAISAIENISPLVNDLGIRVSDENVNPHEISRMISRDPGLTTYVLKRVNSPYYGLVQKIDNIFNAIIILGYNEIYRLVLEERLGQVGIKPSKLDWQHANMVATIAAHLAKLTRCNISGGSLVTLGIMHDIGRTVLEKIGGALPQDETIVDPRQRIEAEIAHYGIDHASLGGVICRQWRIPERTCLAIEAHPLPLFYPLRELAQASQDNLRETCVLAVAEHLAHCYMDGREPSLIGWDYYQYLKIEPSLDTLLDGRIRRELDRIKSFTDEESRPEARLQPAWDQ
ncbi:MAG: HDOD domain protein [Deltaproteobacteria bacterium ADurb.Bin510]|nr:MAG: HDOD domain protein [Deltaproteobacteria bacterium ADurb.Bin510]